MMRSGFRGAAVMMVLVVLALLLALAVSFTFLMIQQEGSSVAALGGEETRIVTRTGADHAMARLNYRNRLNEFARWWATDPSQAAITADDNPFLDWQGESVVDLLYDFEGGGGNAPLFPGLAPVNGKRPFAVEDPKSLVLGLNVQDESGKVNLNFATPEVIANLLGSATVVEDSIPAGGVYPTITLTDASFLAAYDEDSNPRDNRYGGGVVVIDSQLLIYASRIGNVLNNVVPNPRYNGADNNSNSFFRWHSPDRVIRAGAFVTSPTAYKVAYYRYLAAPGRVTLFNTLDDVREIASLPRWLAPAGNLGPTIMGQRLDGWPEGLDPVQFQHLERTATTMAPSPRYDGGFFYPHVVNFGGMSPTGESGKDHLQVNYDTAQAFQSNYYVPFDPRIGANPAQLDPRYTGLGEGNLVRLRLADGTTHIGMTLQGGRGQIAICTAGDLEIAQGQPWLLDVAERAGININTAPFEVVAAVFHGVGPRGKDPTQQPITLDQAHAVASEILARTRSGDRDDAFETLDELHAFLIEMSQRNPPVLHSGQVAAFMNTQRFPYSPVQGIVTAPFTFETMDTYLLDAFATRYMPSGGALAREAFREWVTVGSDTPVEWHWRTYRELAEEMRRPQGNIFNLFASGTANGKLTGVLELPFVHYLQDERLMRKRMDAPWNRPTPQNLYQLADDQQRPEKFFSTVTTLQMPSGQQAEVGDLEAGMFSMWYRPQWEDYTQNHYLYDSAEQEYSNRISLLWWGARQRGYRLAQHNSGLTLRVKDRTLEEAYTELRYELDQDGFRHGDWYHLNMNWKGTHLSHLNMLLDGDCISGGANPARPETNHTFRQINGAWVSRTSTLQHDLEDCRLGNMTTTEIQVDPDDIGAFPDRGVLMIGDEAIEYNGNNGLALLNIYRGPAIPTIPNSAAGARGTIAGYHPRGSRVTVFGYVSPLQQHNTNATGNNEPRWPFLPATRGQLGSGMGSTGIYRVSKVGTNNIQYFRPLELGPDAGFAGAGDDTRGGDPYHLPLADYTGMPERGIVAVYGFAWRNYHPPGTPGIPQPGVSFPDFNPSLPGVETQLNVPGDLQFEYVAYDRIDPQGLHVVRRYDAQFNYKDPTTWWHFLGTYTNLISPSNPADPTNVNQIAFFTAGTAVIPVSLDVDNVSGYHDRSVVQVDEEWFFYNRKWDATQAVDATPNTPLGDDDNLLNLLIEISPNITMQYVLANAATDTKNPAGMANFRGYMGTGIYNHNAGSPVLPTFATTVKTGERDVVTTINGKNYDKELHVIRRQRLYPGNDGIPGNGDDCEIAAFFEHCGHNYQPNPQANNPYNNCNLCKFPTGELPVEIPTTFTFAGADPRTPEGAATQGHGADFDSFEFRMYTKGNFRLSQDMNAAVPTEGGDLQVNTLLPPNLGVVRIDDELVAYRGTETRRVQFTDPVTGQTVQVDTYWLLDVTRGILGTLPAAHAGGTPLMNMASLRVGRPQQAGDQRTDRISLILGEETMRSYGFARIEEPGAPTEVFGYQKYVETQQQQNGLPIRIGSITCGEYHDPAWQQALFRGAYGTRARAYSQRALFFDQPVRFPDWFPGFHVEQGGAQGAWHQNERQGVPGAVTPEISHIQGSLAVRAGVVSEFKWRLAWLPHADQARYQDSIGARLVLRFRGRGQWSRLPEWNEAPTNRPGGLYSFEFTPGASNTQDLGMTLFEQTEDFTRLRESPGGILADRVEWRVYFYFKQDAFLREDYKATPQFGGASMTVRQLSRVLRHEEKR
ncbi:MAG: hypothetical protein IT463_04365 [Planctomycetes bacterium]|nr:hypothetical protein [Planctomycetota bacterium]